MKKLLLSLAVAAGLLSFGSGCSSSTKLDTAYVETTFQTAKPEVKAEVQKVVDSAKAMKYAEALAGLQAIMGNEKFAPTLTPDEEAALLDLGTQLEKLTAKK